MSVSGSNPCLPSRSHIIYTISLIRQSMTVPVTFHLVDLAGSERRYFLNILDMKTYWT